MSVRVPILIRWYCFSFLTNRTLLAYVGPGYMVAVGYMDPGNWATDIAVSLWVKGAREERTLRAGLTCVGCRRSLGGMKALLPD